MKVETKYICEICKSDYSKPQAARDCEKLHEDSFRVTLQNMNSVTLEKWLLVIETGNGFYIATKRKEQHAYCWQALAVVENSHCLILGQQQWPELSDMVRNTIGCSIKVTAYKSAKILFKNEQ